MVGGYFLETKKITTIHTVNTCICECTVTLNLVPRGLLSIFNISFLVVQC